MTTMRAFGDRMRLGAGARLTLIQLKRTAIDAYRRVLPRDAGEDGRLTGALFVDQIEIFPGEDLALVAVQLITLVPECIAIVGGDRREGYQWLGVCQIFAVEHRSEPAHRASRLSLARALQSVDRDVPVRRRAAEMTERMRGGFWWGSEADAEDWGMDLLTLAGVVEMAGHSLGQLVQDSQRGAPKARSAEGWITRSQYIEDRLIEMLEPWVEKGGRLSW